jgi:hypothetical protein
MNQDTVAGTTAHVVSDEDSPRVAVGKEKVKKPKQHKRQGMGDELLKCLECSFIGCGPCSTFAESRQHALQHMLSTGHKFGTFVLQRILCLYAHLIFCLDQLTDLFDTCFVCVLRFLKQSVADIEQPCFVWGVEILYIMRYWRGKWNGWTFVGICPDLDGRSMYCSVPLIPCIL